MKYETSDFPIAVALHALGYTIERLDRTDANRVKFCFNLNTNRANKVVESYWDKSLCLPVHDIHQSQKTLKRRLYSNHD